MLYASLRLFNANFISVLPAVKPTTNRGLRQQYWIHNDKIIELPGMFNTCPQLIEKDSGAWFGSYEKKE